MGSARGLVSRGAGGSDLATRPRGVSPSALGPAGGSWVAVRASQLTKKSENKTLGVFFHAAFDFQATRPRNTTQKLKDKEN